MFKYKLEHNFGIPLKEGSIDELDMDQVVDKYEKSDIAYTIMEDAYETKKKFEEIEVHKDVSYMLNKEIPKFLAVITDQEETYMRIYLIPSKSIIHSVDKNYDGYGGLYEPKTHSIILVLTEKELEILSSGHIPDSLLDRCFHEYAHSYISSEIQIDTLPDDKFDYYYERQGLLQYFYKDNEERDHIGLALEELHAYGIQSECVKLFNKYQSSQDQPELESRYRVIFERVERIFEALSSYTDLSKIDLLRLMTEAKIDPRHNEQKFRKIVESSGHEGLYDKILTFKFKQDSEESLLDSLSEIEKLINEYISPVDFIVNEDNTVSH